MSTHLRARPRLLEQPAPAPARDLPAPGRLQWARPAGAGRGRTGWLAPHGDLDRSAARQAPSRQARRLLRWCGAGRLLQPATRRTVLIQTPRP